MIEITDDLYVRAESVCSIEWTSDRKCKIGLINGQVYQVEGKNASNAWLFFVEGEE